MRPQLAEAILSIARAATGAGAYVPRSQADIERMLWRKTEAFFAEIYAEERDAAPWIDLGGEG